MTVVSTPASNNSMAAVCRRTWGVTRLRLREGQVWRATTTCLARIYCIPSALRGPPRALGNSISLFPLTGSCNHDLKTATVCFVRRATLFAPLADDLDVRTG